MYKVSSGTRSDVTKDTKVTLWLNILKIKHNIIIKSTKVIDVYTCMSLPCNAMGVQVGPLLPNGTRSTRNTILL